MLPALHSVHSILVFPASYAHLVPSLQLVHSEIHKIIYIIPFVQKYANEIDSCTNGILTVTFFPILCSIANFAGGTLCSTIAVLLTFFTICNIAAWGYTE